MRFIARFFIKTLLLVIIIGFALINYRVFSFDKGFSKRDFGENQTVTEFISTVAGIEKVEYYQRTIPKSSTDSNGNTTTYQYNVYIVTNNDAYLGVATQDDIDAFSVLGIFSGNLKPSKISPIPFYVEIIVGLLILIIPFGRKRKRA